MADPPATGPQSDRVSQATGMISVQAGCTLAEAFDLLRERAVDLGQTLEHTALDTLDHIIRFDDPGGRSHE
jgi:AmiR/NasT family two-component response regulator